MRKCRYLIFILLMLIFASGCSDSDKEKPIAEGKFRVYCLNRSETALAYEDYTPSENDREGLIKELITVMRSDMKDSDHKAPLMFDFSVRGCVLEGDQLIVDMSDEYTQLSPTREILIRAALVRTLIQIGGVNTVSITVDDLPLADMTGNYVGAMTADSFVDNEGAEIHAYDKAELRLYFANETGQKLVPVYRTVVYNSNILMERVIVEQILLGPNLRGNDPVLLPTVNPACGIINVSLRDGICYVNLDENFLIETNAVSAEAAIYSIVNSLAELPEVSRVQISVQGDTSASFLDVMPLSTMYTRNLDIMETN